VLFTPENQQALRYIFQAAQVQVWFDTAPDSQLSQHEFCDQSLLQREFKAVGAKWIVDDTVSVDVYEHFFSSSFHAAIVEEFVEKGHTITRELFRGEDRVLRVYRNWQLCEPLTAVSGSIGFSQFATHGIAESLATILFYESGAVCGITVVTYF
jgi:hypothetical protein